MDLSKLKVVDLRAQLQERGLDTKGVKATLIERLKAALDADQGGDAESEEGSDEVVEVVPEDEVEEEPPEPMIEARPRRTRNVSPPPSPEDEDSAQSPVIDEYSANAPVAPPQYVNPEPDLESRMAFVPPTELQAQPVDQPEDLDSDPESPKEEPAPVQSPPPEEDSTSNDAADSAQIQPADHISPAVADEQISQELADETAEPEDEKMDEQEDETPENEEETTENTLDDKEPETEPDHSEETAKSMEVSDDAVVPQAGKDSQESVTSLDTAAVDSSGDTKDNRRRDNEYKSYDSRKRRRSDSKSRSKSPRRLPTPAPNIDDFTNEEDEPEIDPDSLTLSWYDSDLHLRIDATSDFCTARPITTNVLALAWAGTRTTHGVRSGRVAYEVQLTEELRSMFVDQKHLHEFRCGWSKQSVDLQLGESALSFGYGSNGKMSSNNVFSDYGCKYGVGDVIGVYLDMESEPCRIEFTVNGKSQGSAFEFEKSELGENEALFPHIMTKSIAFRVNFGQLERCLLNEYKKVTKPEESIAPPAVEKPTEEATATEEVPIEKAEEEPAETKEVSNSNDDDEEMPMADEKVKVEKLEEETCPPEHQEFEATIAKMEAAEEAAIVKMEAVEEETVVKMEAGEEESVLKMEAVEEVKEEPTEETDEKPAEEAVLEPKQEDAEPEEEDDGVEKVLLPGYIFIGKVPVEELVKGYERPTTRKDCEVILMVGLPGAGKTHWAKQYAADNQHKYFNILGTHVLFEKMKIDGESRKSYHVGRFEKLNEYSIKSLSALQDIANKRRRNYILDQTNVYASAQRRKMKGFGDFKRIAVVVIPDDEEFKRRMELKVKAENKDAPDPALNEMKANFSLPSIEFGWFDELRYTDLEAETAKAKVEEYNEKGRKALPAPQSGYKRFRRDDYGRDRDRRRRDDRGDRDRDRRPSRWGPNADANRRGGGGRDRWSGAPHPPMPLMQNWRGGGGGGGGYDQRRDRWGPPGGGMQNNHRGGGGGRFEPRGFRGPQGPPPMHHYNNGPPRPYGGGGGGGMGGGDRRDRRGDDRRGPRNDRNDYRGGDRDSRDNRDRRDNKGKMDPKKGPGGGNHKGYSSNGSGGHSNQSQYGQGGWNSGGGGHAGGNWVNWNYGNQGVAAGWSGTQQGVGAWPQQPQQNWGNWQNNQSGNGSGGASNWKGYQSSSNSGGQYGSSAQGASATSTASASAAQQQQWASWWNQQQQQSNPAGAQHQQSGGNWSSWQQPYQPAYSTTYSQQPPNQNAASKPGGVADKK